MLAQAEKALEGKAVKFLSLNTGRQSKADIDGWFRKHGGEGMWAANHDETGATKLHEAYKKEFKFIPSIFVVDADGVILGHFGGIHDKSELIDIIEPALK